MKQDREQDNKDNDYTNQQYTEPNPWKNYTNVTTAAPGHPRTVLNLPRLNTYLLDLTDIPLIDKVQTYKSDACEEMKPLETAESLMEGSEDGSPRGIGMSWGLARSSTLPAPSPKKYFKRPKDTNTDKAMDLEFYDARETSDTEDTFRPRISSTSIRRGLKEEEFDLVRDKQGVFDRPEWHEERKSDEK